MHFSEDSHSPSKHLENTESCFSNYTLNSSFVLRLPQHCGLSRNAGYILKSVLLFFAASHTFTYLPNSWPLALLIKRRI